MNGEENSAHGEKDWEGCLALQFLKSSLSKTVSSQPLLSQKHTKRLLLLTYYLPHVCIGGCWFFVLSPTVQKHTFFSVLNSLRSYSIILNTE
jgi:hypothetical protein